jgi:hypothetical protein
MPTKSDVDGLLEAVFDDVHRASKLLDGEDTAFNRRVLVRTIYSSIEAFVSYLKYRAVEQHAQGGLSCSSAQLALLKEESYSLDAAGKVQVQPKFIPLDQNFRFLVSVFLHRDHLPLVVDWGQDGWDCFRKGLRKRNEITHPRHGGDLIVSDEDLEVVRKGHKFVMTTVINQFIRALESKSDRK